MREIFKNKKVKSAANALKKEDVKHFSVAFGADGIPHQKQNTRKRNMFFGSRVLIMGLGLHGGGVGTAKFFCRQKAKVLVTDLKTKEQLKESINKLKSFPIKYVLGKHQEKDFINSDLIIKNPDVPNSSPYLKIAKHHNIPVESDISLFFKLSKAFIIGVTGTKGKSTTASLIYELLKPKYKRVFLAGNIGISPLELLSKIKRGDKVVLELSSFELENLKISPRVAVITNIFPDHLNRYANMRDYIDAKKIIFKYQKKNDFLILNYDDPLVRQFAKEAKSKVYFFPDTRKAPFVRLKDFKLAGVHNWYNLLAALSVAKLLKVPAESIKKSIKRFKGIPGRQEFVKEMNGVKYFNDTTATVPDATIQALKTFSNKFPNSNIILIVGGQNKGLNYSGLSEEIKEKADSLVMLPGTASDKIKEGLAGDFRIHEVSSMREAVKKSAELATKGDVVVLSPAAASFNLFKNEFDRGKQFVNAVKNLSKR